MPTINLPDLDTTVHSPYFAFGNLTNIISSTATEGTVPAKDPVPTAKDSTTKEDTLR